MSTGSNLVRLPRIPALSWDDCRLLVESVVDYAIFMLDTDGRVATWNVGAQKIKGYLAAEIIGQHFSKFFLPEDRAAGKPELELRLAAEQGRFEDESWRVRKDGSLFWANVIITALRDEQGQLRGFGKVTRDLTARRDAELRIRQAEERFHGLVDAVTDYAIYLLDANGHVATWNSGAERIKGYRAAEIIGKHFSLFYTEDSQKAGKPAFVLDTVRKHGRFEEEEWRVRKDGTKFWANVVITALRDETKKLIGFAKVTRDLTERRQAEEALRHVEERFRLLVENVADYAIYMLDPLGRVATWNLGAKRLKGYTAVEILGHSFQCFFPDEDVVAGKPAKELEVARTTGRFEDEGWRVRKDGSRFWANAILTAMRDQQGDLIGFAKITRDLTARREGEQKSRQLLREQTAREVAEREEGRLRQSEQRYRELSRRLEIVFEGVADGITVQDQTGKLVFANTAAAKICGFATSDELLRAAPAEVLARFEVSDVNGQPVGPADLPASRVLAGEGSANAVLRIRERATQKNWWVQLRATPVLGDDGRPNLAVNIWHDVTAERRHEIQAKYLADATAALTGSLDPDAMLTSLARLLVPGMADRCSIYLQEEGSLRELATIHAGPAEIQAAAEYRNRSPSDAAHASGAWSVVLSGQTRVVNDMGEAMRAQSTTDPQALATLRSLGMTAAMLVPIPVAERVLGVIALFSIHPGRGYEAADVALIEELGRRTGAALENVRLYRAAQQAARAAEQAARQAEEAARVAEEASRAKDEFLATVSHELRTPLNAILGWASLLKDRMPEGPMKRPVEVIHRNAHAQVQLIDDILDMSRVVTGKFLIDPRPADLVTIIREAMEVVRPAAEAKRIALVFVPEMASSLLVADPQRLQQVAWNLLWNAIKFTDRDGSIEVMLRKAGSRVIFSVKDNGQGIDPAFLPFVFDRFRQADSSMTRRFGGLGLGLALVRHIVELHGGHVEVFSEGKGKGATFRVELPVQAVVPHHHPAPANQQGASFPSQAVILTGVRVLVVDDEADARDLIATVLTGSGAQVETAGSVREGLELLPRFRPNVLVSDVSMPDEDGFAFIRQVRALSDTRLASIPALALTAFAGERDKSQALLAGFTAHLGKPVEPDLLASSVADVWARRSKESR